MLVKRKQGRPKRDIVNGRDMLIEGARSYLRSRPKLTISRTEIAEECGVTPALLSYYFKDRKSLIDAVTKPLIRTYTQRLNTIQAELTSESDRMRQIIRLLIEMNADDAFLVDYLMQDIGLSALDADDRSSIDLFRETISNLLDTLMTTGVWRQMDPLRARLSLWGTCRILGEALSAQSRTVVPNTFDRSIILRDSVEFVYKMFADPDAEGEQLHDGAAHRHRLADGRSVSMGPSP